MEKLFGIPITQLLVALVIAFAIIMGVMAILAWRNRVFLKMAARNIVRRPVQTALILVGLMLASLLFSASFSTGDTLTHSIRTEAIERLGLLDIVVRSEASDVTGRSQYFDEAYFDKIRGALIGLDSVDGVAPYIAEQAPALAPETRLSEPQVGILGIDPRWMEGFGALKARDGQELSVLDLGDSDIYISRQASEKLGVTAGDSLGLFFGPVPTMVQVKGVYDSGSILGGDVSAVLPLSRVQGLTGNSGEINRVLVSNAGGLLDGAEKSDQVLVVLEPLLDGTELEAIPIKQDTVATADQAGSIFSSIFILFGQFSIAAGILLIFLIFVMLAAERRRELGIARAVGTRQSHVVLLFTLEGGMYALLAGLVGAFLGILVGWGMVGIMATAFGEEGFRLVHTFRFQSVAMAYVLGVVLTFMVVVISAWRVSRTNVVRAIRDIPEPRLERRSRRSLLLALALPVLGVAITLGGIQAKQWGSYLLGTSMILVGIPLLARRLGWLPDRFAYTLAAILLLAWWFVPSSVHKAMVPATEEFQQGIEMFFLSGIMLVLAGVWLVIYNVHFLLDGIVFVIGKVRGLPPILKTAISYPMEHRFRTGMTLAMFSLVVFTLIVMAFILHATAGMLSDPEELSGGFEIRTDVSYANPIADMSEALSRGSDVSKDDFAAIASFTAMPVQVRQEGSAKEEWSDMLIQGADSGYTGYVTYAMSTNVARYDSPREVWQALQSEPGTVIVSPYLVPTRANYSFGVPAAFQLEGFYADDRPMPEVYLEVKNTSSGAVTKLKVIGVMEQGAYYGQMMVTGRATLDSLVGQPLPPRAFWFDTKPGVDVAATARALEARFLENGLQAEVMAEEIERNSRTQLMVNNLLQGFMGLGLVVGIAALGVIAARSVVERRREIGMARAIGFQRIMVQTSFLLESSFVALLGIGIGVALGMGLSVQILDEMTSFFPSLQYQVPVANVVIVVLIAYFASLLTTFIPSVQASRVYPAEALRYE